MASIVPSEALEATYLTVDPAGRVGASFTGKVHAQGLDLDAGTTGTPPDIDRVRWLRTTDAKVVADMLAAFTGNSIAAYRAYDPDNVATRWAGLQFVVP